MFTKLFQFPSGDARTFGLLIQAIGMTMASVLIIIKRIPILPHVIGYSSLGGGVGVILGVFFFQIPTPFPKLLFTFVATAFGAALAFSRWGTHWSPLADVRDWSYYHRFVFVLFGFVGGAFAANTGAGTDMLAFIVLILAFGIDEKISTPTSVIIMSINSVIGAFMYIFVVQEVGIVWDYWLIPFTPAIMTFIVAALIISVVGFVAMLYYRQKILVVRLERPFPKLQITDDQKQSA